jgi:hypothetical protein
MLACWLTCIWLVWLCVVWLWVVAPPGAVVCALFAGGVRVLSVAVDGRFESLPCSAAFFAPSR